MKRILQWLVERQKKKAERNALVPVLFPMDGLIPLDEIGLRHLSSSITAFMDEERENGHFRRDASGFVEGLERVVKEGKLFVLVSDGSIRVSRAFARILIRESTALGFIIGTECKLPLFSFTELWIGGSLNSIGIEVTVTFN
jgi:hypothetical protein